MVAWQGHKMSKSRGNLVFVSALRHEGVEPMAIRLALLAHHYRSDWTWTVQGLEGAERRLALWRTGTSVAAGPDGQAVLTRVRDYLAQDLRTPEILDAIDEWARAAVDGVGNDSSAPQLIQDLVDALLGVRLVKG
jgi:L-cysteine:1D-myo-inositol 2-amino-2-deoxy-alpha-D-glucopyranoside ligase